LILNNIIYQKGVYQSIPYNMNVKVNPYYAYAVTERRRRYSSSNFATSALEGVGSQDHALAALTQGKKQYP
jgi:hypothetical protein